MLSPTTSFADVECDTRVEDSRKTEVLNEKIEELGTLVSETNNRLRDVEAEAVLLKTQLDESQKLNVINAEEISDMTEMTGEAKSKATNLKDQFDDAKKMHEIERQELHEKLEDVEARTGELKSQLDESQKLHVINAEEISAMAEEIIGLVMSTTTNSDALSRDSVSDSAVSSTLLRSQQLGEVTSLSSNRSHPPARPLSSLPVDDGAPSGSGTALYSSLSSHQTPRLTPCSLLPSSWSKRRVCIATCGCLTSTVVCTVRLILDPGPSAYIIHSVIILFDMVLIHVFTNSLWLSIVGEITAVVFATCYHFTGQTIFELMETTLIAVWVSFHMIQSRNEHWDHEDDLERNIIGLQSCIELRPATNEEGGSSKSHGTWEGRTLVQQSNVTNVSALFASTLTVRNGEDRGAANDRGRCRVWWDHFFDHFLDGSAGVMYTSFLGLIIDEIVNYSNDKSKL